MNTKAEFRVDWTEENEWTYTNEQIERQTDKQTDRQTNKQTDKQTETELPCKLSTWKKGNEDEQIMLSVAH